MANYQNIQLIIIQNLPGGRVVTTQGTLNADQILNVHGTNYLWMVGNSMVTQVFGMSSVQLGEQGSVNDALLALNAKGYNSAKMCYYDTVHSTIQYTASFGASTNPHTTLTWTRVKRDFNRINFYPVIKDIFDAANTRDDGTGNETAVKAKIETLVTTHLSSASNDVFAANNVGR